MAKKAKRAKGPAQLPLARTGGHGGRREGAGRKKKEGRGDVAHVARRKLLAKTPVHVTLRARPGRPSMRAALIRTMFEEIIGEIRSKDFQVTDYSLQHDHLHLICEPGSRRVLETAMRRLTIRFSLRLNALFGRSDGKNWSGRYHRHDLKTPREVRNALVYV